VDANTRILRAVCDTLGWGLGISWGIDRFSQVLHVGEVWHLVTADPSEFVHVSKNITFAEGIGLPGRVWATGEPVWIRDVLEDSSFPRFEAAAKVVLHSAFAFPIKVEGKVHGVFEFYSHDILEPDKDLLDMVEEIGINVGQFVERKETEAALTEAEAQLRQAQKMEAIGRVAGGVAHDFNNLLTVITGYTHLLLSQIDQHDPMRNEIEEIKKAGNRAASLTGQLLAFSRRQVIAPQVLDLNTVVSNMEGMLRRLLGEDIIELVTVLVPDLGKVQADPGQLDQVIMNLAVNARDAMPQGGKLEIETSNARIGGTEGGKPGMVPPGSYARLVLTDTGCGMDQKTLSQVFEPFFTTKDQGKGTGLGLSTVYGIVKQNGGDILVDSQVGKGTRVMMYFPTVNEEITEGLVESSPQMTHTADETILVVEDEPGVRGLVTAALRNWGYSVLEARDGIHAQVVSKSHFGQIDLLLTDVVMPQKSGPEAAKELLMDRPDMKVLYMSGYPDHPVFSNGPVDKTKLLMQKPFMPESLTRRVREVLEMSGEEFQRLHPVS
jgi:signal transduction histidine kinase/CheY-like chemotaxis protein